MTRTNTVWWPALVCIALASACAPAVCAWGPTIGIVAHPMARHGEYIAASYVKWVESAGGRVVPIPYNAPTAYLDALLPQLNGLLFPGGDADINDKAKYLYKAALRLNDQGVHFPVWGTCLGFEWLLQCTAEDDNVLDKGLDAMNISLPLNFTVDARASRLFSHASEELYGWMKDKPMTMNNHENGIAVRRFNQNKRLAEFYTVLSTNEDRRGLEFVSAMEAKQYPIFAVQFHPEKSNFEYGQYPDGTPYEVIDHSYEAVLMSQYFANFFVNEARKNDQRFHNAKDEHGALIYNYKTYTIKWPSFVESYVFKHDFDREYWSIN